MAQPKKSRAGCITCKRRRSKCDETKPACLECQKRGLTCEGYATSFKWKSFKGMPKDAAPNEKPHKQDFEYHGRTPVAKVETTFVHNDTNDVMFAPYHNYSVEVRKPTGGEPPAKRRVMSEGCVDSAGSVNHLSDPGVRHHSVAITGTHDGTTHTSHGTIGTVRTVGSVGSATSVIGAVGAVGAVGVGVGVGVASGSGIVASAVTSGPTGVAVGTVGAVASQGKDTQTYESVLVLPEYKQHSVQTQHYQDKSYPQHPQTNVPSHQQHLQSHSQSHSPHIQQHIQSGPGQPRHTQHNQHIQNNSGQMVLGGNNSGSVSQPQYYIHAPMDDYYTRISRLFDHHTCGIVTIKDGPSDNPWRTSLWPLAQHNPVLYHAIAAMTLFHTARGNIDIRREAFSHMRESIQALASGISTLQPHVALATTLSLAFAESWDQHITTGMLHLRGSKPLVKGLLAKYDRRLPSWLLFLYNSYVYLDVLARLTSSGVPDDDDVLEVGVAGLSGYDSDGQTNGDVQDSDINGNSRAARTGNAGNDPLDIAPVISADLIQLQQQLPDLTSSPPPVIRPHARDMHPPGAADGIDPLLGCAQTLFPVIGKIGTLANRVARFEADESTVSQASVLMRLLQQWRPATAVQYFVNDPDWDLKSCLNTAEAYRYAAIIHLVQAVPQVQKESLTVTTQRVLSLLEAIPTSSRTCTTHIFPLLVAGCEAQGSQRHFVKRRWDSLAVRLWIGNVDRAVEVMEEVWRQRDRMGWRGEPVGVTSPAYWSQVMKNWRWEVLLG
ncbi:Transcriptional regulatory protein [Yarrowia sp. B02]|nr:Transcriptional regulatory protein [Yarrowia sp. B02]